MVAISSIRFAVWSIVLVLSLLSLFYTVDVSYTISIQTRKVALAAAAGMNHSHLHLASATKAVVGEEPSFLRARVSTAPLQDSSPAENGGSDTDVVESTPIIRAALAKFTDLTPFGESCPQTKTQLIEHRERRTEPVSLTSFLQGPGLKAMRENSTDTAACWFVDAEYSRHFPHAMEQLYRCWSFWRANPEKKPILVHPDGYAHFPRGDPRLSQEREISRLKSSEQILFFRGMSLALLEVFDIKTTVTKPSVPLVRSTDIDGFWQHSFALERPEHARELADGLVDFYGLAKETRAGCQKEKRVPRIAILNRETEESKRSILNAETLASEIKSKVLNDPTADVPIMLFEDKNFLEQVDFYASFDIVVSPHGAQLTGLPFMPQCGGLVEVFPMGYYYPEYFGSLAESVGLDYQALYSSEGNLDEEVAIWMSDTPHRRRVRELNFCPSTDAIVEAVLSSVEAWSSCCHDN